MSAAELDRLLGDPWDDANPAGYAAILAGDECGEPAGPVTELLNAYGIGAELVPPELGGRLAGADDLARVLTTLARRDARLAASWAFGPLEVALQAWRSGSRERRQTMAGLLLANQRPAGPPGAAAGPSGLVAQAITARLGLGPLDAALRAALGNSLTRRLYDGLVADLPYVRATIARAYADLLAVDALTAAVLGAIEPAADALPLYAPAADYLAARLAADAFDGLRSVLGARAFLRAGPFAIFQKAARDTAAIAVLRGTQPGRLTRIWRGLVSAGAGADALLGCLDQAVDVAWPDDRVRLLAARLSRDVVALRGDLVPAAGPGRAAPGGPGRELDVAARYALLLAAACALAAPQGDLPSDALAGVLDRLTGRLGGPPALTTAERTDVEHQLSEIAIERYQARKPFDLTARSIPG